MSRALLVSCLQNRAARRTLREQVDCDWVHLSSPGRIAKHVFARPPRLFVLEVTREQPFDADAVIEPLRRERPLADWVLWLPQGNAAQVRRFFHLGVADVVVSRDEAKLAEAVQAVLRKQQFQPQLDQLRGQRARGARFDALLSRSDAMWDLFDLCTRIATTNANVLIIGETGTGKELLARAIHRRSGRSGRFVAANCASLSSELLNSELFGYERGAFTGADRARKGLVLHADQGTLLLDEIGDMPPEGQLSLLRMLQERKIRPVGSLTEIPVDVRVIAATHVSLDVAVREGSFREDLFYRLDVIRMNVPPLRERPEDILFLFGTFTKRHARQYGLDPPTFSNSFFDALLEYGWPGNVRQLENFSERLVLSRTPRALTRKDFNRLKANRDNETRDGRSQPPPAFQLDLSRSLEENLAPWVSQLERDYLDRLLRACHGTIGAAAEQAGISRRTLLRKMKQYGMDKRDYKK